MTAKRVLTALGQVFAAEIEGRLPFQSRAKIMRELCEQGLLEPMERILGVGTWFPVIVRGYQLTHAGRITYCQSCDEETPDAA
jgi:hypothetical protein